MKDPHIHVERSVIITDADLRGTVTVVTGLAVDAPKTVTTGCGRRRPYAMTTTVPESVTCLACADHGRTEHRQAADSARSLLRLADTGQVTLDPVERRRVTEQADQHEMMVGRYPGAARTPPTTNHP